MRIESGFDRTATAAQVAAGHDVSGKRMIITGASAGIGVETARVLAAQGAEIVLAVRDVQAGEAVADAIRAAGGAAYVSALDLADLRSVRAFAAREGDRPLHALINNAGVMACPLSRTAQGFEMQLGVNHVGHALLVALLAEALKRGAPARVVAVSSSGHWWSPFDFEDPNFETRAYDKWKAYGQSKTANALFAVGFDARYAAHGVRAFSLMPGAIHTSLGRHLTDEDKARLGISENSPSSAFWKTVEQGAATSVWAVVGRELDGVGGLYLEDVNQARPATPDKPMRGVQPFALDPDSAEKLWIWTEDAIARAGA
ncbi:MAG: SDR family NAD(P)-dependent oxidoreductase [Hyphomonadaceae bacterium]